MLSTKLKEAAGNSADATLYVDDVFSTWLYDGTGATQTITNGIDLAGKGGLVFKKSRNNTGAPTWNDSARGLSNGFLRSDATSAASGSSNIITAFNSNGFDVGGSGSNAGDTYASWTFRKAAKFFDVVTYTGDGVNGRAIPHNLGIAPGMIIVKSTSNSSAWVVYHRSLSVPTNKALYLNTTSAELTSPYFPTLPTSSVFYTNGDGYEVNTTGQTYVAYLYAHDTSSTGIIQCGSFTTDGSGNATVNLGWEPQYWLYKNTGVENWQVYDTMRGWSQTSIFNLSPNTSSAEGGGAAHLFYPTATGFECVGGALAASTKFIYMAIRMPNKPPTTGTQVFSPLYSASPASTVQTTNFPVDMQIARINGAGNGSFVMDRLRGVNSVVTTTVGTPYVKTNTTGSEVNTTNLTNYWSNTGFLISSYLANAGSRYYNFKRAPGFFDEVCYTGTGVTLTVNHNLGVVPELVIIKTRSGGFGWPVWRTANGTGNVWGLMLNTTAGEANQGTPLMSSAPTVTTITLPMYQPVNDNPYTYVAYLFATLAGISKVGSYTGNGTGQAIACGFGAAGARFVLIKRTDSTGDWYTYDSVSGLTSGSSPYVLLNSTAAEVTGNNGVYASTGGFTLGATAITTTNIATATYIFLAVA